MSNRDSEANEALLREPLIPFLVMAIAIHGAILSSVRVDTHTNKTHREVLPAFDIALTEAATSRAPERPKSPTELDAGRFGSDSARLLDESTNAERAVVSSNVPAAATVAELRPRSVKRPDDVRSADAAGRPRRSRAAAPVMQERSRLVDPGTESSEHNTIPPPPADTAEASTMNTDSAGVVQAAHPMRLSAADIGRQISEVSDSYSKSPPQEERMPERTAYVGQVRTDRLAAEAYERTWQDKVERVGNMNYPEEARRKQLTGGLLMAVAVNSDGSIQQVSVQRSSGHQELDEAAERIVRLAAPFAAFPSQLKKDYDVLVITRTWRFFTDNRLATSP